MLPGVAVRCHYYTLCSRAPCGRQFVCLMRSWRLVTSGTLRALFRRLRLCQVHARYIKGLCGPEALIFLNEHRQAFLVDGGNATI